MASWTKANILAKVKNDLDLNEETLITEIEFTGYLHEAIAECQAIIHSIDEDYFLRSKSLAVTTGVKRVSLPADIYASKIRGLMYNDGSLRYAVKRVRNYREFETLAEIDANPTISDLYRYILVNDDATTDMQIELYPTPLADTTLTLWYLRDAALPSADTDVCDIPEFVSFIIAHIKRSCMAKEGLGVAPEAANQNVAKLEDRMRVTLANRVPDEDTGIQVDMGHYREHT